MSVSLDNMSVLIVDDNPVNIQILAGALRANHRVRVANSGLKTLEVAVSDDPPDIILLDIMMPEMDGYEVCRRLKNNPKTMDIPIIFVTAKAESDDEAFGLNLGAVDYISKPYSLPVVKARVRAHLQLKQRTDMLAELAMLDGLTGIANRRNFDLALEREWGRSVRKISDIALIMLDIDFFKAYNDHYGHGAGDECLRLTAQALEACVHRPTDLVARYGGEEFCVLLPETDAAGTGKMAEALRRSVKKLALPHAFSTVADHVTISAGYASVIATPDSSPTLLLQNVDSALYIAKKRGRNRAVNFGDGQTP